MRWKDSDNLGRSGFVQSRLYNSFHWEEGHKCLAEIELHEGVYYVSFPGTRYVEYIRCKTLEEAKAVAVVQARFNQAEQLTN